MEIALERREAQHSLLDRLRDRGNAAKKSRQLASRIEQDRASTSASLIAPKRKAVNKQQSVAQSTPADNGFVDAA